MIQKEKQEGKIRCFIAVEIPDKIKKNIESLAKEIGVLKGIREVSLENVHITVKFLGYLTEEKLNKIKERLSGVQFSPFSIELRGIGVFPSEKRPRVVWIDCRSEELRLLAEKINDILAKDVPTGDFTAHLTIARVKETGGREEIKKFLQKYKEEKYGTCMCEEFVLKKSDLTKGGPVYTTLEKYTL